MPTRQAAYTWRGGYTATVLFIAYSHLVECAGLSSFCFLRKTFVLEILETRLGVKTEE